MKYRCETCQDRGTEQVVVGKIASGITVYAETDIPCRVCSRKAAKALREITAADERIRSDVFTFEGACRLLGYPLPKEN